MYLLLLLVDDNEICYDSQQRIEIFSSTLEEIFFYTKNILYLLSHV
jgi:hypothetical protein